ncbi:MAG: HAMP domain-containing histidine kinase [Euryarchaeota archaeon]|nr:HAMP domain-containing histidine kinase [Euryarchaeota archaeon]
MPAKDAAPTRDEVEELRRMHLLTTNLINAAAHELSTPLTPIRLQLHLLKEGVRGKLTPEQRWSLEVVDRNFERLQTFVKELLDVARLEAQRLPILMQPTDLASVLREALETYEEPMKHAGLTLKSHVEPDLVVLADTRRLIQVVFNLLNNALKYTPSGGTVTIKAARSGHNAEVAVMDTGKGLTQDQRGKLFTAFGQIYGPDTGAPTGAGLGLFITRNIVELHGGQISVQSDGPGRGSAFTFTIPLARKGEHALAVQSAQPPASAAEGFSRRIRQLV